MLSAKILEMLFICVAVTFIICVSGQYVQDHYGSLLYNDLFKNYNPNVRPVGDASKPALVDLIMDVVKILAVDEIKQTFKTTVNIMLAWIDERLVWNVTDYGNIQRLVFPLKENIWVPDIMNFNAAYHPGELGQKYAFPSVSHNGMVYIWLRVNLETQCEIRTKKFPFDVQQCDIDFTTFGSTDDELRLKTTQNSTELRYYVETAEWAITKNYVTMVVEMSDGFPYRIISYRFSLERTCSSCIVNTLFPVIILAILNLLSFFVPTESGEKLTFPMSVFLTLAVFLTIIMVSLPESVDGVSYLCTFVTFELGVSATTLLFTVVTLRLHHEMGDAQVPPYARLMVKIFRRSCIKDGKGKQFSSSNTAGLCEEMVSGKTDLNENSDVINTEISTGHADNQSLDIRWEFVSDAFDMMMFLIVIVTQFIVLTVFLILMVV